MFQDQGGGSNIQMSMSAEASLPVGPKWILMNFPWTREREAGSSYSSYYYGLAGGGRGDGRPLTKREELSLRMVLAFPKASMAGLASMIWSSREPWREEAQEE